MRISGKYVPLQLESGFRMLFFSHALTRVASTLKITVVDLAKGPAAKGALAKSTTTYPNS